VDDARAAESGSCMRGRGQIAVCAIEAHPVHEGKGLLRVGRPAEMMAGSISIRRTKARTGLAFVAAHPTQERGGMGCPRLSVGFEFRVSMMDRVARPRKRHTLAGCLSFITGHRDRRTQGQGQPANL